MQSFATVEEVLDAGKLLHTLEIAIKKSKDELTVEVTGNSPATARAD